MLNEDVTVSDILRKHSKSISGYIRVSANNISLKQLRKQKDIIKNFCKNYNIKCKKMYIDKGYSGLNFERPSFKKMMQLKENEVILITDISRLSNKLSDIVNMIQQTDKIFISITDFKIIKNLSKIS